jgi:hypothetical protein
LRITLFEMKEIAIHEIMDGMVLAADVLDEKGQVLFAAGRSLEKTHVALLERRGVLTVKVATPEEDADDEAGPLSAEELESAIKRLDHMFEPHQQDPIMRAIYAAARGMLESAMPGRT